MANALYYGDNLGYMREMNRESVDLIYLDPPFNSKATYNLLFRSPKGGSVQAQTTAFRDTWTWDIPAETAFDEVLSSGSSAAVLLRALRSFLGESDLMAYLAMMSVRLIELQRVLKRAGSLYLHCDPTASHYLKLLLDGVFQTSNFESEISWKRTGTHSSARRWGPVHDVIFFYSKDSGRHVWNRLYVPLSDEHLAVHYRKVDDDGRRYEHGELTGAGTRKGKSGESWRGFDVTGIGRHWTKKWTPNLGPAA
jgi:adenine specific DNA methylase Mod